MNGPRTTEEIIERIDQCHHLALRTGNTELIWGIEALQRALEDLDADIEHAVTTLRRGQDSPRAQRQREQRRSRDAWRVR